MMKTWNEGHSGNVNLSQENQVLVCVWNQSPKKRLLFGLFPLLFSNFFCCKKLFLKDPQGTVAILANYSSRLHSAIRLKSLEIPVQADRVKFIKLCHHFYQYLMKVIDLLERSPNAHSVTCFEKVSRQIHAFIFEKFVPKYSYYPLLYSHSFMCALRVSIWFSRDTSIRSWVM